MTLIDVAERAGVSRATASLVLRGTGRVSDATRERVHAAMAELGYVYNRGAASLRTSRSNVIGALVTTVTNPFFAEVLVGLEEELARSGYVTLIANTLNDVDRQARLATFLQETDVDGVVVVPAFDTPPDALESFATRGIPVLFLSRAIGAEPSLYIGTDDVAGGRLAADHLFWHGCPEILYVGGRPDAVARQDRLGGVLAVADERGVGNDAIADVTCPTTARGGYATGLEIVARKTIPEGIVAHSDTVALGLYRALHDAGRAAEVRVVSFDDIDSAELFEPPLTSVSGSPVEIGRHAAHAIARSIAGEEPVAESALLTPHLTVRRSCGCDE
jgi:LacI family transcriptional regulator